MHFCKRDSVYAYVYSIYIQKPCLVVNMFFDFDSMLQGEDA